jgi:hypothetical protein
MSKVTLSKPTPESGNTQVSSRVTLGATTAAPLSLQRKLTVNTPGDKYEQEADRVAEQVMRMPEPQIQRQCTCGNGSSGGECEECKKKKLTTSGFLQREAISPSVGFSAPPIVNEVLSTSGSPLPHSACGFMESRFGHDFSHVRVHTGSSAERSSAAVNARAYTVGNHIVFGKGMSPSNDLNLVAHELTHVVQQGTGNLRTTSSISSTRLQRSDFEWCWSPRAWWRGECELAPLEATEELGDSLGGAWKEYVDKNIDKILDLIRGYIPEGPARTAFDIIVGVRQGAVEFIEGIVSGVFSLLKKSTWKGLAALAAKIRQEGFGFIVELIAQVIAQTIGEYEKELVAARATGKEAQVRAKWITRIVAEVVSLIIPGAAATKGAKAGTVAKVAEGASAAAKTTEVLADVGKTAKATEAVSDIGKAAHAAETTSEATKVAHTAETASEATKAATLVEDTVKVIAKSPSGRAIRVAKEGLIWVCHSPCEQLRELFSRIKPQVGVATAKEIETSIQRLENMAKAYSHGELPQSVVDEIANLTQRIERLESGAAETSGRLATQGSKAASESVATGQTWTKGGGKNAPHAGIGKKLSAQERYVELREKFKRLDAAREKTPELKEELETVRRQMEKAKKDAAFAGENHSQRSKRRR